MEEFTPVGVSVLPFILSLPGAALAKHLFVFSLLKLLWISLLKEFFLDCTPWFYYVYDPNELEHKMHIAYSRWSYIIVNAGFLLVVVLYPFLFILFTSAAY
jgi:hypothetical protein